VDERCGLPGSSPVFKHLRRVDNSQVSLLRPGSSCPYRSSLQRAFIRQTGLGLWRRSLLRVEGELALPLICDDLLAGSSLL
jgi:hypothetical protein